MNISINAAISQQILSETMHYFTALRMITVSTRGVHNPRHTYDNRKITVYNVWIVCEGDGQKRAGIGWQSMSQLYVTDLPGVSYFLVKF